MRNGVRHRKGTPGLARGARKLVAVVIVEGLGIVALASMIGLPILSQSNFFAPMPMSSGQVEPTTQAPSDFQAESITIPGENIYHAQDPRTPENQRRPYR
ncbi:MAG: hypothetical protein WDZ51_17745 [Pirellulaceae bacterium]